MHIIATGITSLDEARYFSAMGVDWMGFNGDQLSTDEINAIADWVVGPKLFAELSRLDEDALFEISHKTPLTGICVLQDALIPNWYQGRLIRHIRRGVPAGPEHHDDILLFKGIPDDADHSILTEHECWFEITVSELTSGLAEPSDTNGLLIRCLDKNVHTENAYDIYDAFFETLEATGIK